MTIDYVGYIIGLDVYEVAVSAEETSLYVDFTFNEFEELVLSSAQTFLNRCPIFRI